MFSSSLALTTTRIQAAHVAPAKPSRRLLPPFASLRSGGVQPRRGRRAPEGSGAERGAPPIRAGTSQPPSAALPSAESCPPCCDRRGPRCAHRLPRTPQPPPSRRVGVRARYRSASVPLPVVASGGPHGPPLRETAGSPRRPRGGDPAGQARAAALTLRLNASTDAAGIAPP